MKVGVVATHGREGLPEAVVASLERDPIEGIVPIIADELAVQNNNRFTGEINMAKAYPGSPDSEHYGYRRAAEVVALCDREQFDLIIDLHTTLNHSMNVLYATYHDRYLITNNRAQGWGAFLINGDILGWEQEHPLINVVVANNPSIGWSFRQAVCVELSVDSPFANVPYWRLALGHLAAVGADEKDEYPTASLDYYMRVGSLQVEERDRLHLPKDCPPFTLLPVNTERYVEKFGSRELYAISWGEHDDYMPYCGELAIAHAGLRLLGGTSPRCCDYHKELWEPTPKTSEAKLVDVAFEGTL